MEIIGKPWKRLPWQMQKVIDNFGLDKIQIKYINRTKDGGWNFSKFQVIYCTPKDWRFFNKKQNSD